MNVAVHAYLRLSNKYFCQWPYTSGNEIMGKSSKALRIRLSVAHLVRVLLFKLMSGVAEVVKFWGVQLINYV